MALNEVYKPGKRLPLTLPVGVVSGHPVVLGSLVGVAQTDRDANGLVSVDTDGVYELTITGAIAAGAVVYAVVAGGLVTSLTATAGANTYFGISLTTLAATGLAQVRLGYP